MFIDTEIYLNLHKCVFCVLDDELHVIRDLHNTNICRQSRGEYIEEEKRQRIIKGVEPNWRTQVMLWNDRE